MKYLTQYVPQGSGISDGYVAIEEAGVLKAQKLSFNGTEAVPDGAAEAIGNVGLFTSGMNEPAYNGTGGGFCKYYKCASVDTMAQTWTGYELILTDGKYTVSSEITTGLAYTNMTPSVNYIYSEDALIRVDIYYNGIPTDGLVFYASLNGEKPYTAETGQVLNQVSADASYPVQYVTEAGVPCAAFGSAYYGVDHGYCGLIFPSEGMPSGTEPRTISCWIKLYSLSDSDTLLALGTVYNSERFSIRWYNNYQTFIVDGHYTGIRMEDSIDDGLSWHHLVITFDESNINGAQFYINGTAVSTLPDGSNPMSTVLPSYCVIGAGEYGNYAGFDGWLSSVRIYNRVLSPEEIIILSQEFTPTV